MAIGNTNGAAAYIGGDGSHFPQSRGGKELVTKIGKGSVYLKGDMAAGRSEDSTTEGREIKEKGGM